MSNNRINVSGAGEAIKQLRDSSGLNATELSKLLGISKSLLSHYENDRKSVSTEFIRNLAGALELDFNFVLSECLDTAFPELKSLQMDKTKAVIAKALKRQE